MRTVETNSQLPNASPVSPHLSGLGFDISAERFDIIHEDSGQFMSLDNKDTDNRMNSLRTVINTVLSDILIEMDQAGELTYTFEGDHHHVTALSRLNS